MGNVTQIGSQLYRYDRLNRLVSGQVQVGANLRTQSQIYDVFGSMTSMVTNGSTLSMPTDPATNRLQSPLANHDGAGNVTRLDFGSGEYDYTYDSVNTMKAISFNADVKSVYIYNAYNERLAQKLCESSSCSFETASTTWTVRDFNGKILRTYFDSENNGWIWKADYIHSGAVAIAAVVSDNEAGQIHYLHPDHLGSPRQVTSSAGTQSAFHTYYPFGQAATVAAPDDISLKFTGHERASGTGSRAELDYMHARFCSPNIGRFLSFDPVGGTQTVPQSWNRYHYALGNPIRFVDPQGMFFTPSFFFGGLLPVFDEITVTGRSPNVDPAGFFSLVGFRLLLRDLNVLTGNSAEFPGRNMTNEAPPQTDEHVVRGMCR